MAIQTDYVFSGVTVPNAYVRIENIHGWKNHPWTALVRVYNIVTENVVDEDGNPDTFEDYKLIAEFEKSAEYVEDENCYVTLYNAIKAQYGGTDV